MRSLGFRPAVDMLPAGHDPAYLARLTFGPHAPVSEAERRTARAIAHRHTHRGRFAPDPVSEELIEELCVHAHLEGAALRVVDGTEELAHLAELVRDAEGTQRADQRYADELAEHVGPLGVPAQASRRYPDTTLLPGRDYLSITRHRAPARGHEPGTGPVLVLTTQRDGIADWLRAGQALQRVLLHATTLGVSAAFHTQPLELPETREAMRRRVTGRQYPQMILRLGFARYTWTTERRGPAQTLVREEGPMAA
jgi:hypothetical protein